MVYRPIGRFLVIYFCSGGLGNAPAARVFYDMIKTEKVVETMQETIVNIVNQFGYLGVGGLIAIENVFPPIPSEVILTFAGFMTIYSNMNVWLVIFSATVGAVVGALILYSIGWLVKPSQLERLLSGRLGKILRLEPADVQKAISWFNRKGYLTVFFCRFIPIVRSLISIPAGTARMNLVTFLLLTTLGTAIWNTVLVWLGVLAGESWKIVVEYFDTYSTVTLVVIGIVGLAALVIFYAKRAGKRE